MKNDCKECKRLRRENESLRGSIGSVSELEPDALAVVSEFIKRLLAGQQEYGKLDIDTDDRDWQREAMEENLDSTVYQIINQIKMKRTGK